MIKKIEEAEAHGLAVAKGDKVNFLTTTNYTNYTNFLF